MVGTYIDHRVTRIGKVRTFEVGVSEQRPLEITPCKISFLKRSVAKINLFGFALPHHQSLYVQTEKIAIIEDTLAKTKRIGIEQTFPIPHRPIDTDHLARHEIDIAHFRIGQLHDTQIAVLKTAFDKLAREKKGFTKITRDKRTVFKLRFAYLLAMQINALEFLGEYVHVVGDAILDAHKIS